MKKVTNHKVEFFTSEAFKGKYNLQKMTEYEKTTLFSEIEKEYISMLYNTCTNEMRKNQELEYKLNYYRNVPRYVASIKRELSKVDLSTCNKYKHYMSVIG